MKLVGYSVVVVAGKREDTKRANHRFNDLTQSNKPNPTQTNQGESCFTTALLWQNWPQKNGCRFRCSNSESGHFDTQATEVHQFCNEAS